jgi:hypothetical protein
MEWGRPASGSGSAEGTDHVWNIQRRKPVEKMGEIPVSSQAELSQ